MSTSQVSQKQVVKRAERIIGSEAVEGERVARLSWSRRQTALQFSGENLIAAASSSLLFFFLLRAHDVRAWAEPTFKIPVPF